MSRACAPLRPKLRSGPLQGAVRLVTREQERQQQRTSVKSLALSESMSTESSTDCGPRLLGPLLNLSRKRKRLWLLLRELPGLRQILRVMPRRLAPRVEMRRRSSRMPMRGWVVEKAARPNIRLERQVPQVPPREEQPSNKTTKKRHRRRRRRKRSVTKEVARAAQQQCECTTAPNLLVGDSLVAREAGRFFSQLRPANSERAFPGARVKKVTEEVAKLNLYRDSTLLLTVGGNDLFLKNKNRRCVSSEGLVGDFDWLIRTAKSKTSRLIVVGLVPRKNRSGEEYSRALGVNRRLESLCKSYSIRFIDPRATFYGRDSLFQRDGTHHFSSHGARVFARLLNKRLFKPVASRSWGPGRAEPRAPLAGPPSEGVTAKRAPPRKPPPEAPNKVATVPLPSPPPPVMDLVQSPHMEGSSLDPGGSGSPDPPSGPSKKPRSPPTGEPVSPTQGPSQKRRCDQDGRDGEEPHERGPNPSPSGNGSPSIVVVSP